MTNPITGLACIKNGANSVLSISKNMTIALIYAVMHRGHFGSNISNIVERNDMEPLVPFAFLDIGNLDLQQVDLTGSIAIC